MANTTLHSQGLTHDVQTVSSALHDLAVATQRLLQAVWATFTHRPEPSPALTALQEANQLRTYADRISACDPHHAQDLYAVAMRHEVQAMAQEAQRR